MSNKLSLNPPKGTSDRFPEEFAVRKYIFDTWRSVCTSFGYEEYLGPLVEDAALRKAKSGEDVGGSELTQITNRNGDISDLALRPEMTPTVTRMVVKNRRHMPKPVRRFSIANFYRNERPQRGRNREFWQCNVDLFGSESLQADIEVLQMAIELLLAFGADQSQFSVRINHRALVNAFLDAVLGLDDDIKVEAIRTMDKWDKLSQEDFVKILSDKGCTDEQCTKIVQFMSTDDIYTLSQSFPSIVDEQGVRELTEILQKLDSLGYGEYIMFQSSLMRGFDYYDGMVFEVFDLHPDNNRAMFGGGRYNGLAGIFGSKQDIPAVGFAPGDEPMKLFLESRGMIDDIYEQTKSELRYIPLLEEGQEDLVLQKAKELRSQGKNVEVGLKVMKENKMRDYIKKKGIARERVILV